MSEQPEKLQEKVVAIMDYLKVPQAKVAKEAGVSRSTLSQWLSGQYEHSGMVDSAIKTWILRVTRGEKFIDLRNSALVMEACRYAEAETAMVLIVGEPGLGKTVALREYMRRKLHKGEEIHYYHISPTKRESSLAKMLARKMELSEHGSSDDLIESVVSNLHRRPVPMIFDECNHLNIRSLEIVRYIYDAARVPVVIAGSKRLQLTLTQAYDTGTELAQFHSRIGLRAILSRIGLGETKKILEHHFDGKVSKDTVAVFHERSAGVPRDLVNGIRNVKRIMIENGIELLEPEHADAAFTNQLLVAAS